MSQKYDGLRRALEAAPSEELVSFSFAEIDKLVNGLPPSARKYRSWWGNTFSPRPHADAWMSTGRQIIELRMGEAVVFSAADGPTSGEGGETSLPREKSFVVLDGVEALRLTLEKAGHKTIEEAVASHTIFLHPDTVSQTRGKAVFRHVRDPTRRGTIGDQDGARVMFDDNTGPKLAFLWASQRRPGPDVQYNHVWGDPRNVDTYTALWNLCVTPAFLAKTTDGSNHPQVQALLRYRAFDLFGFVPEGEEKPTRPSGYDGLNWPESPAPVLGLEDILRKRLHGAPKSTPAISAREIGWLFSSTPDATIPARSD